MFCVVQTNILDRPFCRASSYHERPSVPVRPRWNRTVPTLQFLEQRRKQVLVTSSTTAPRFEKASFELRASKECNLQTIQSHRRQWLSKLISKFLDHEPLTRFRNYEQLHCKSDATPERSNWANPTSKPWYHLDSRPKPATDWCLHDVLASVEWAGAALFDSGNLNGNIFRKTN